MAKSISLSKEELASLKKEIEEKGHVFSADEKQFLTHLVSKASTAINADPVPGGWSWTYHIPGT